MTSTLALAALLAASPLPTQDPSTCPLHAQHSQYADLDARGDRVMGFDHTRTTHHFLLRAKGGVIQVAANDPADRPSIDQIRSHLAEVAKAFAAGSFAMPEAIHGRVLPGVQAMIEHRAEIAYTFKESERGGEVAIVTANEKARAAVHAFLSAQIEDHRTGDPLTVQ
jgi:hypothetical protein